MRHIEKPAFFVSSIQLLNLKKVPHLMVDHRIDPTCNFQLKTHCRPYIDIQAHVEMPHRHLSQHGQQGVAG